MISLANKRSTEPLRDLSNSNGPAKINSLTSMRFFAALYVVAYHTFGGMRPASEMFVRKFIDLGFVGVSFFFLLSGYVLSIVYLHDCLTINIPKFFLARFARIYPLFLVTLAADMPHVLLYRFRELGVLAGTADGVLDLAAHVLLIHAWIPNLAISIDSPNWSLSAEAFFYSCFPFVGMFLWKIRRRSVLVAVALIVYVSGLALARFASQHFSSEVFRFNPALHLSTFVLGILLARWQSLEGPRQNRQRRGLWILALSGLSFQLVVFLSPLLPFGSLFDGLLAPIFMAVIYALSDRTNWVTIALSNRWLVLLGESSFGLYLIHMVVRHFVDHLQNLHWIDFKHTSWQLSYIAVCIGLSVASYRYLESPSREFLLRRFRSSGMRQSVAR